MSLQTTDIAAIAEAMQTLAENKSLSHVQAVSLKLPVFWNAKPEVWFIQVEAQFATRNVTVDTTKHHYVVASLDNSTAGEVEALLLHPPELHKYETLKSALIKAFGKSQQQKDNELLALSGLGDRKPSALLRHIQSLNSTPETLLRALFLAQLPIEVCRVLAGTVDLSLEDLACNADRVLEASYADVSAGSICVINPTPPASVNTLCFYHGRFKEKAKKCNLKDCRLRHLLPAASTSGNDQADR